MFKAFDRVKKKIVYGDWETVCQLDKRSWEIFPVVLDANNEEVPQPKIPLTVFKVKTENGGTREVKVFSLSDLEGIFI